MTGCKNDYILNLSFYVPTLIQNLNHTTSQYGPVWTVVFPKTISAWNGLVFAEAPSLLYLDQIFLTISVNPFRIIP